MMTAHKVERILKEKLGAERVEVSDESHRHAGHPEARRSGGGHFRVTIIAESFAGRSPIERQRLVYEALGHEMKSEIHALSMRTYTPHEWKAS